MDWNVKKKQGYTIIEVMLVIVVISIVALYSYNYMRKQTLEKTINQSALQMESLMQIAVTYYSRENKWPQNMTEFQTKNYVKNGDLCSPWPSTNASNNPECPNRQVYKVADFPVGKNEQNALFFGVKVDVPSAEIAQQLSAVLPNSKVSGNTVMLYAGARQYINKTKNGWISSAGIVVNSGKVDLPLCGDGYEGHVIFTPQYFSGDEKIVTPNNWKPWETANRYLDFYFLINSWTSVTGANPNFPSQNGYVYEDPNRQIYAFFFTFCIPNGKWKLKLPTDTVDINENITSNGTQCNSSWKRYNKGVTTDCR